MRLIVWLLWRWLGAFNVDEVMLAGMLAAIEEDGRRTRIRTAEMGAGDLVIFTPDPLLLGGELLVLEVTAENQMVCEAVHWDAEHEDDAPPRGIFNPHDLELASRWARAA